MKVSKKMMLDMAPADPRSEYYYQRFNLPRTLAAVVCLAVYSQAISYGIPLFFLVALMLFIWFGLIRKRLTVPLNVGTIFFFGTLTFYCIGLLRTGHAYAETNRDLRNALDLVLIMPLLFSQNPRELLIFNNSVQSMNSSCSALIALLGLYKFELLAHDVEINLLVVADRPYPQGSSLVTDYNFFAFAMLVGTISSIFCIRRSSTLWGKIYHQAAFLISAVALALSGSRRGWVTEAVLMAALCGLIVLSMSRFPVNPRCRTTYNLNPQHLRLGAAFLIVFCLAAVFLFAYLRFVDRASQDQTEGLRYRLLTLSDPAQAFAPRSQRWEYSLQLLGDYSPQELLFGHGFDYLRLFANRFKMDSIEDYPHNPVISAALYSGLPGALWVSSFLVVAGLRFYARRKDDPYFAILYAVALLFVLPSLNSLFSVKALGLLLLIPWLLRPTKYRSLPL